MNRKEMIRMLVDCSLAAAAENAHQSWLRDIFTKGFAGFATMSNAQLSRELRLRGLSEYEEPVEEDCPEEDDVEDIAIEHLRGPKRSRSYDDAERD